MRKTLRRVAGMFLGGLLALAAVGWLMEARMGQAVSTGAAPVGTSGGGPPQPAPAEARLVLFGWQDFMGFVDFGGKGVIVPIDHLVFGAARRIGTTAVALVEPVPPRGTP